MAGERKIAAKVSIEGTDSARQDLKKVQTAVEAFGDEGKSAASKVTNALGNIQDASDRLEKKIQSGRVVTSRDIGAMVQQYEHLRDEINRTFGSLDKAPAELQNAFKIAEKQVDEATRKVRILDDAAKDHKRTLDESGYAYGGLGNTIQDALGKGGAAWGKLTIGVAAAAEGLSIGQRIAKAIGTDFSEFESVAASLAARLNLIRQAFVDLLADIMSIGSDVISGNWRRAIQDAEDFGKSMSRVGTDVKAAMSLSKEGIDGLIAAQNAGLQVGKLTAETQQKLADIGRIYADVQKGGADAQTIWNRELADAKGNLDVFSERIKAHAPYIQQLADATDKASDSTKKLASAEAELDAKIRDVIQSRYLEKASLEEAQTDYALASMAVADAQAQLGYYERQSATASAAVDEQRRRVAELTQQYGANDFATKSAQDKLQQLEAQYVSAQQRIAQQRAEVADYEAEVKKASAAVDEHTKSIKDLDASASKLGAQDGLQKVSELLQGLASLGVAGGGGAALQAIADALGNIVEQLDKIDPSKIDTITTAFKQLQQLGESEGGDGGDSGNFIQKSGDTASRRSV